MLRRLILVVALALTFVGCQSARIIQHGIEQGVIR